MKYQAYSTSSIDNEWSGKFSKLDSLAGQSNIMVQSWMKQQVDSQPIDLSIYNKPFNEQTLAEELNQSPAWMIDSMIEAKPKNWEEFAKKKRWYEVQAKTNEEVQKHFSGGTQLLSGLTFGLADVDALLLTPMFKVGKAVTAKYKAPMDTTKPLTTAQKWGLGAEFAAYGAGAAATSNFMYEAASETWNEGSTINSMLVGAGLGGGLGLLAGQLASRQSKTVDVLGNSVDEAQLNFMKQEEIRQKEQELAELEKAYAVQKSIRETRKKVEKEFKASTTTEFNQQKAERAAHKQKIKELESLMKEATNDTNVRKRDVEQARKQLAKLNKDIENHNTAKDNHTLLSRDKESFTKEYNGIQEKIQTAVAGINKARETLTYTKDSIVRGHLEAFINQNQKAIAKLDKEANEWLKEIDKIDTKLSKSKYTEESINIHNQNLRSKAEISNFINMNKDFNRDGYIQELMKEKEISQAALDVVEGRFTKDKMGRSDYNLAKQQELARYNDIVNNVQAFKAFLQDKGMLTDEIFRMKDKKFSLPGLIRQKQNTIQKLNDELKGIETTMTTWDKIKNSNAFKNAPTFLQKFVISPIEKLYGSSTDAVRGFAELLHPGTLYHSGKTGNNSAMHIRVRLDRLVAKAINNHRAAFKEAKANGYKGNEVQFEEAVTKEIYRINGKAQRAAREGIDRTLPKEQFEKQVRANLEKSNREYTTTDKHVIKAVDEWLNYYEYIGNYGRNLKMIDFENIIPKAYMRRKASADKIQAIGEKNAVARLVEMQKNYAKDNNLPLDEKAFEERAYGFVKTALDRSQDVKSVTQPLGARQADAANAIQARKILAYDDELMDLLEDNVSGITETYKLKVHGRVALKEKLGVDEMSQLEDMFDKIGANNAEKDNLRIVITSIIGNREIPKNPFSTGNRIYSALGSASSLAHIMSFGIPTLTEIAAPIMKVGFKPVAQNLFGSIDNVYDIYRYGDIKDVNGLQYLAEIGQHYMNHKLNRADIENIYSDTSKAQTVANELVRKGGIYGGMLPITDALKLTAITSDLTWLAGLDAKTISKSDVIKLEQMGFVTDDIPRLKRAIRVDESGKVDLTKELSEGDAKFRQQLDDALWNFRQSTILHPDGSTLPAIMTDVNESAFLSRIFFKFMRFPMESYERLLLNGVQHADAKVAAGVMLNTSLWALILTAKDAVRDDDKKKYTGEDGWMNLFKDSVMYNSIVSGPIAMTDKALSLAGTSLSGYETTMGGVIEKDVKNILTGNPKIGFYGVNIEPVDAATSLLNTLGIWNDEAVSTLPNK